MNVKRWLRSHSDRVQEAEAILREAARGDTETVRRVVEILRTQSNGYCTRTQTEIDGIIARYWASHPRPSGRHTGDPGAA